VAAGEPVGPQIARYRAALAAQAVPEWQATLDALAELDCVGAGGPAGFWGVSLGSAIGVPFAAAKPRITAAVFGLAGHETLAEAAVRVTVPVEFLLQWDDELVPRDSGLALFGAFPPARRRCTPTPAATRAYPCLNWTAQSASSPATSAKAAFPRRPHSRLIAIVALPRKRKG
jgi:dienelactone hydrolase